MNSRRVWAQLETTLPEGRTSALWTSETVPFKSESMAAYNLTLLHLPNCSCGGSHPLVVYTCTEWAVLRDEISRFKTGPDTLLGYLIRRGAIVLCPEYRGNSWLNPAACGRPLADPARSQATLLDPFACHVRHLDGRYLGINVTCCWLRKYIQIDGVVAASLRAMSRRCGANRKISKSRTRWLPRMGVRL